MINSYFLPEDVMDLAFGLREAGFNIGVDQCLIAQHLLVSLAAQGSAFVDHRRLATWLGPIFCSTPREQTEFRIHYESWLNRRSKKIDLTLDSGEEKSQLSSQDQTSVSAKTKGTVGAIVLLICLGIGFLTLYLHHRLVLRTIQGIILNQNDQPVSGAYISFQGQTSTSDTNGTFTLPFRLADLPQSVSASVGNAQTSFVLNTKNYRGPLTLRIEVIPSSSTPSSVENSTNQLGAVPDSQPPKEGTVVPATNWRKAFYRNYYSLIFVVATAAPLGLLGLWLFWVYLPRLQLVRWKSRDKLEIEGLSVQGTTVELFKSGSFRRMAQELRRHRQVGSMTLDAERTVNETIQHGGWFTPYYAHRNELPGYLLLVDRTGFSDLYPRLMQQLIKGLRQDNVEVDSYYFYGAPDLCYQESLEGYIGDIPSRTSVQSWVRTQNKHSSASFEERTTSTETVPAEVSLLRGISIEDLAARYPDHQLLVFSDAWGFFNPRNGQVHSWVERLAKWNFRALLVPEGMLTSSEDYRISILETMGFTVLPANTAGLARAAEIVHGSASWSDAISRSSGRAYPSLLRNEETRWMSDIVPEPALVSRLVAQLHSYLGTEGFNWFAACAVYPELSWDLTLYLGHELGLLRKPAEGQLDSILRLPWFQFGFMPGWLRQRLLDRLSQTQKREIRDALWRLMETALYRPLRGFVLSYAKDVRKEVSSSTWREKLRSRLLRNFLRTEPPGSALNDYVLLSFLRNRGPGKGFPVPKVLRPLWGKFGQPRRPLIQVSVTGLAMVLIATTMMSTSGKLQARDALKKGVDAFKQGKLDVSIEYFKQAKDLDPSLVNAPLYLATAYASEYIPGAPSASNTKVGSQAINEFKEVLSIDPNNLYAIDGIGSVLFQMAGTPYDSQKLEESKSYEQMHLRLKPNDPEPYYFIGIIDWTIAYRADSEMRLDYNEKNIRKKLMDSDPLPDAVRSQYAQKYGSLIDEGIAALQKAITLKPDYDDAMAYLNLLYRRKADAVETIDERNALLKQADDLIDRVKEIKQQRASPGTS